MNTHAPHKWTKNVTHAPHDTKSEPPLDDPNQHVDEPPNITHSSCDCNELQLKLTLSAKKRHWFTEEPVKNNQDSTINHLPWRKQPVEQKSSSGSPREHNVQNGLLEIQKIFEWAVLMEPITPKSNLTLQNFQQKQCNSQSAPKRGWQWPLWDATAEGLINNSP